MVELNCICFCLFCCTFSLLCYLCFRYSFLDCDASFKKDCPCLIISGVLLNFLLFYVLLVLFVVPFLREKECCDLYCVCTIMSYYVIVYGIAHVHKIKNRSNYHAVCK